MSQQKHIINNKCDTKTKIFSEAARLFAEKGYYGVSMREISERANVTKPTIYYYFGNKEGIYEELISESINRMDELNERIRQQQGTAKEKLINLVKYNFVACLKHPEYIKFLYSIFTSRENLSFLNDFKKKAFKERKLLIDIIKQGVASEEFGAGADPELASLIIEAVINQFIWLHLETDTMKLSDELAEKIIELIFKGLNE